MSVKFINFLDMPYDLQLETRNWRNKNNVSQFFKIKYIDEDTHIKWLQKLASKNPSMIAFFIENDGAYVGVTYFHSIDCEKKIGDWGIYIKDDAYRGKGLGRKALTWCIDYAKSILKLDVLFLDVLKTNDKALGLYQSCGFSQIETENSEFLRFKKVL